MDFEIHFTIHVDIDCIINFYCLHTKSTYDEINFAIVDYCENYLDDGEYYYIGTEEIAQIRNEIKNRLGRQMKIDECF